MKKSNRLAYYIEDLWTKGFKLTDEEVRFIYFGKNSTDAPEWKIMLALRITLRVQKSFDASFFLSLLELLNSDTIKTKKEANTALKDKGFV
ncbi:DUF6123 family protein [Aquibacillus saliphilus]|uniref:DUF6123 family protein n=1 Tax=Aquibacillus saliphilus TaxID=1909422 RepID=UPI001CF0934F|nr:DUF6123 family protein [Aquibacillus saliphilus]